MPFEDPQAVPDIRLYHAWRAAELLADVMEHYFERDYEVTYDAAEHDPLSHLALEDDPGAIKLQVDRLCDRLAGAYLKSLYPDYGFVGEESFAGDPSQIERDLFWCVDPICGSKGYRERTPFFGTSVALVERGRGPILGVMNTPALGMRALGDLDNGYLRLEGVYAPRDPHGLNLVISSNQKNNHIYRRALELLAPARVETMTGVPPKSLLVLGGAMDAYFMLPRSVRGGRLRIWDLAASQVLHQLRGTILSDVYGRPLDLSGAGGDLMPLGVIMARDQATHDAVAAALAQVIAEAEAEGGGD